MVGDELDMVFDVEGVRSRVFGLGIYKGVDLFRVGKKRE